MDTQISGNLPRPGLLKFTVAWIIAWLLASWLSELLLSSDQGYGFQPRILLYFTLLSAFQMFAIRWFLRVELLRWIHLAIAGAITGLVVYHLMLDSQLLQYPSQLTFIIFNLTLWSTPPLFQWLALRRRFQHHALWLLAAIIIAPLSSYLQSFDSPGVFLQGLPLLARFVASLDAVDFLASALLTADAAIPAVVLGLVLYVVILQGGNSDSDDRATA